MADKNNAPSAGNAGNATDSIVLEEEIDPNYVPSEDEVLEYAKWLGMDLQADLDLFWVAKEGLMAPLPKNWKPCKTKDTEDIYYFNFATGESTWDHPCDGYYKRLFEEEKKKKETSAKESSDQNRTQAKADVEKLLGKTEKKKKKRVEALETPSVGKKGTPGSAISAKPVLGPLGGTSSTFEKKPLPGISALQSKAAKSHSEVSLLTASDGSGAGIREESRAVRRNNNDDDQSTSTVATKKSKMSMRLNTVVADSDELQLDMTPKKGAVHVAAAAVADRQGAARAEAKAERAEPREAGVKPVPAPVPVPAPASALASSPGKARSQPPSAQQQSSPPKKVPTQDALFAEAQRGADSKQATAYSAAAAPQAKSTSSSASSSFAREGDMDAAELEGKLRDCEKALQKQTTALESCRLELADAERRVSRANQRQAIAEETETALHRQLKDAKEQHSLLESLNEQLDKENKELRVSMHKKISEADEAIDKTVSSAVVDSLKEELRVSENAERRALEMQKSLREELLTQTTFHESKLRSSDLALASAKEDQAQLQTELQAAKDEAQTIAKTHAVELATAKKESETLIAKYSKDVADNSQTSVALLAQVESLTAELAKMPKTQKEVVEVVHLHRETSEADEVAELKRSNNRLTLDVRSAKDEAEDMRSRCKRFEQLAASWEADCADRETRLSASRARATESESKCHDLESEALALAAKLKQSAQEVESAEAQAQARVKTLEAGQLERASEVQLLRSSKADVDGQLQAVVALNASKQREIDALQLQLAAARDVAAPVAAEGSLSAGSSSSELQAAKEQKRAYEAEVERLEGEVLTLSQRCSMHSEKGSLVQGELESLRELFTAYKNTRTNADTSIESASREQVELLEKEVADTRKYLQAACSERDLLRMQVSRSGHDQDLWNAKTALAESEIAALRSNVQEKTSKVLELQAELRKAREQAPAAFDASGAERAVAAARSQIADQNEQIKQLEEALARAHRSEVSRSEELARSQFQVESEKRARQLLEEELLETGAAAARVKKELVALRNSVDAGSGASAAFSMGSILRDSTNTSNQAGIVELSIKLGQQSSALAALEQKLGEATHTILSMKQGAAKAAPAQVPVPVPAEREAARPEEGAEDLDKSMLIREMMLEFIQRRKPLTRGDQVAEQAELGRDKQHWQSVLVREVKFIAEARRVLKEEKLAIRWEQQLLLKRRDSWKSQKHGRSSGTQDLLNQQTVQLNAAVEQARRTQDWLDTRERKLASLQQLTEAAGNPSIDLQITSLAVELDADTLDLGLGYQALQMGFQQLSVMPLEQHMQRSGGYPLAASSRHRNTYLDAQTENARPLPRKASGSLAQLSDRHEHRNAAKEVQKLTQERAQANAAYEEHIGWLSSLRKDISTFQQEQGAASSKGRAFIDAVVQEKFEI